MAIVELTASNFEDTLAGAGVLLIDFWAEWCGPCKHFGPVFEASAGNHTDLVYAKCNTDEQQELAAAFGIRSIPTLAIFRDNVLLYHQPGALPPHALEDLIQQTLTLDMEEVHRRIAEAEANEAGDADPDPDEA